MIRVFPRKTKWTPDDPLAFIGDPQLFRPPDQPVRISVSFTWDIVEGKRLLEAWSQYYSDVLLGGPALGDPGGEFTPGLFLKPGVTITSRGCPRHCPWCDVPDREGPIRELEIKPGWIVQDNNFLACSQSHIVNVFDMLRTQNQAIKFSGGLDPRLLEPWHVGLFNSIKVNELWFSCDSREGLPALEKARRMLGNRFSKDALRCYVLVKYFPGETPQMAEERLYAVYQIGLLPFCMVYNPTLAPLPREWSFLLRKWTRPPAYRART